MTKEHNRFQVSRSSDVVPKRRKLEAWQLRSGFWSVSYVAEKMQLIGLFLLFPPLLFVAKNLAHATFTTTNDNKANHDYLFM